LNCVPVNEYVTVSTLDGRVLEYTLVWRNVHSFFAHRRDAVLSCERVVTEHVSRAYV
jgi:hypothetical protein